MHIFSIKTAILATNFLYEHICAHEWDYASNLNYHIVFWKENMATSPNFPELPRNSQLYFFENCFTGKTIKYSFELHYLAPVKEKRLWLQFHFTSHNGNKFLVKEYPNKPFEVPKYYSMSFN